VLAMPDEVGQPGGLLAQRLGYLFLTVHPEGRGPYSHAEVAEAINKVAGKNIISTVYIWQLRTGQRDNPTMRHLSALAAFFGVSPAYFFSDGQTDQDGTQAELVKVLRDDSVRDLALRAAGLSDRSLKAIRQIIEGARSAEGLTGPDTHG
jgi:transcriptional regulator with XRE-family HTH domain